MADLQDIYIALVAHAPDCIQKSFVIWMNELAAQTSRCREEDGSESRVYVNLPDDLIAALLRDALTRAIEVKGWVVMRGTNTMTGTSIVAIWPADKWGGQHTFRDGDDLHRLYAAFLHIHGVQP